MNSFSIHQAHALKENECLSFQLETDNGKVKGFIVKSNGQFYAYRNQCPHTGVNLEWRENQFLDASEDYIQCGTHGAKFRIEDGLCIYGPCQGQSLIPLAVEASQEQIKVNCK